MKLHLLFVFLLAAPLIGRVLSSELATSSDATGSNGRKGAEVQTVPAPAIAPDPADTPQSRVSTPVPAAPKPAGSRTSCARSPGIK